MQWAQGLIELRNGLVARTNTVGIFFGPEPQAFFSGGTQGRHKLVLVNGVN